MKLKKFEEIVLKSLSDMEEEDDLFNYMVSDLIEKLLYKIECNIQ